MLVPAIIWLIFLFAFGACIGSFLNVVVYRLPRDMSLVTPGSHCTSCQKAIAWYDNIPVLAWFYLGGKCRHCKSPYSFRYPAIELLTGILFAGLYWLYFQCHLRGNLASFEEGGWIVYLGHIILIAILLSSSLIDAELWIIPLQLSYFAVAAGFVLGGVSPYLAADIPQDVWRVVPFTGPKASVISLGAMTGLLISLGLIKTRVLKRSFHELEQAERAWFEQKKKELGLAKANSGGPNREKLYEIEPPTPEELGVPVNIRREMVREMAFLVPILVTSGVFLLIFMGESPLRDKIITLFNQQKWLSGLSGSIFGFMIGGVTVWLTRILGTLSFGREAMGLGDVHLMAGVGAILGWITPVMAFFIAPFAGLGWALARLILRGRREIPYGPFLSIGTLVVMIFHDPLVNYFILSLMRQDVAY